MRRKRNVVPVLLVGLALAGLAAAWGVRLKRQAEVTRTLSMIAAVEIALQDLIADRPDWRERQRATAGAADTRVLDDGESRALFAELDKGGALSVPPERRREGRVLDAWGRPLRVAVGQSAGGELLFEITSAGHDGAWDTDDDLRRTVLSEPGPPGARTRPATSRESGP